MDELGGLLLGKDVPKSVGIPVAINDQVIGCVKLQSLAQENMFSEADVRLLSTITLIWALRSKCWCTGCPAGALGRASEPGQERLPGGYEP
jgi:hypothetical protein